MALQMSSYHEIIVFTKSAAVDIHFCTCNESGTLSEGIWVLIKTAKKEKNPSSSYFKKPDNILWSNPIIFWHIGLNGAPVLVVSVSFKGAVQSELQKSI